MLQLPPQKLKEIVVKEGLVTAEQFDDYLKESERLNQKIEEVLISKGAVSLEYLYSLFSRYIDIPIASLTMESIDKDALVRLSQDIARQKQAVVFKREENGMFAVAMENPADLKTVEFLERNLKARIKPYLALPSDLEKGFTIYSRIMAEGFKKIIEDNIRASLQVKEEKEEKSAVAMPIVAIVDTFVSYAMAMKASDVHVEVLESEVLVRFRIDGILYEMIRIPKEAHSPILARVKLLSGLKIDEHFKPQDGRFRQKLGGGDIIDVRVSVMPTLYGEKIEMRLLPAVQKPLSLSEVGMSEDTIQLVRDNMKKSYGMILVTGPTGSGKTTTLYAMLNILNKPEVNIVTVEDPIEYNIKYINQTQINTLAGITFASALRAFLRQDPNIILVGEIRDEETAEIAVNAALTGHLILSTLHTNDAPTAIPRFIDMKVAPFLMAAVVNVIIAQRLVRRICLACIESVSISDAVRKDIEGQKKNIGGGEEFNIPHILFHGRGCPVCNFTGYLGRLGIFEVLGIDEDMRRYIVSSDFTLDGVRDLARKKGMRSIFEDGLRKAELGQTTIEEVLRVVRE